MSKNWTCEATFIQKWETPLLFPRKYEVVFTSFLRILGREEIFQDGKF